MDWLSIVAISLSAAAGALVRYALGVSLNPILINLPLGTLAANLIGGLLMGIAMGVFTEFETVPLAVRLAVTTGFLGGLTTFSTFSGETAALLMRAHYGWAAALVIAHVLGSVLATFAGFGLARVALRA